MGFTSDGRGLDVEGAPRPEERRKLKLRPLTRLAPYIVRYRGRALAALIALVVAALTTLIVPVAVRRMIDFGFSDKALQLIDSYFAVMIAVVAVLAISSAMRYYLVTTLGERIVADLRSDVFAHLTRLSSSFFDTARTGEIVSRLTADTTQIKSAVGASVSIALRNLLLFLGGAAMMVVTSPRLSLFVLGAIPIIVLPLVGFGRAVRSRGRAAQDTLAEASGYADELIGAVRTLQAFTNEKLAQSRFSAAVERAFAAARDATKARGVLTAIVIFLVFASIVVVLWVGAQDVLAGHITPGRLGQFVLYAVFAAGGLSELSQVWGEIAQASGAAERLFEILNVEPQIKAPPRPLALPTPARGAVEFKDVSFEYPGRPQRAGSRSCFVSRRARREACSGRPVGRRQKHRLSADPAVLRSRGGNRQLRRGQCGRRRSGGITLAYRSGAAGRGDLRHKRQREHSVRPPRCHRRGNREGGRSRARVGLHPSPAGRL